MNSKHLFRIFVLLVVLFSAFGSSQQAMAQAPEAVVIVRELTYWNATYTGYVDVSRYEKWPFTFTESNNFYVTATPTSGDLTPLLLLLDASGNEITRGTGTFTSTQPAGNYFVQVQPQAGSGFYELIIRRVVQEGPSVTTAVTPTSLTVGQTASVSVSLGNVAAGGYRSAEFTCTYNANLLEVSNIVATNLFGADPVMVVNGPQNGSFIVAIAGSDGNRATTDGVAFTFSVTGLQAGQATIECHARVSTGDNVLTDLTSTSANLTVNEVVQNGTLTGQVLASKAVTVSLYNPDDSLATSAAANADGTFSLTAPAGTYTVVATASGFLSAEGPATITAGGTSTKATISLLAGDIDGNGVIDQLDAMTIGMSYNTATPAAADLNADGVINVLDLELLASNYRATGPINWP